MKLQVNEAFTSGLRVMEGRSFVLLTFMKFVFYFFLSCNLNFLHVNAQTSLSVVPPTAAWSPLIQNETFSKFTNVILPSYVNFNRILNSAHLSPECRNDIHLAIKSLDVHHHWWAFLLFNSWGKFLPSGAFRGTLTDYGDFDQCISIDTPIVAQYCLVDVALPMPKPVPRDVNYYHNTTVLPSNVYVEHSNDSVFLKLSEHSTLFYYNKIETGVCLPKSCQIQNIKHYSSQGKSCLKKVCYKFQTLEFVFFFLLLQNCPALV